MHMAVIIFSWSAAINLFILMIQNITDLQWLKHYGLFYHGCFKLALESLGNLG